MWRWNYEKSGVFSVRSAYKLSHNLAHGHQTSQRNSASGDATRPMRNNIWLAPVPTKTRIFGWRLAADNFATKFNKWRRSVETVNTCSICGTMPEESFMQLLLAQKPKP
jgi:hypothetical protein